MDSAKKRGGGSHMTLNQKEMLINFMESNPKLYIGYFDNSFSAKDATVLWKTISEELNSVPGACKDWKGWRKAWYDIKTIVKSKSAEIRKQSSGTGGGRHINLELTALEEKVLALISATSVAGDEQVNETPVILEFLPNVSDGTSIQNLEIFNKDNETVAEASNVERPVPPLVINVERPVPTVEKRPTNRPRKRRVETALEHTKAATKAFEEKCKKMIELKENYYAKKIEILERIAKAKEQKVQSMNVLTEAVVTVAIVLTGGNVDIPQEE